MKDFDGLFEPGSDMEELWKNALVAGFHEVEGFVAHDKHDYKGAAQSFHKSLLHTMPWIESSVLLEAAKEKTEVLRIHDQVEESEGTKEEKLADKRWSQVTLHGEKEARLLGLDPAYGKSKMDFYRLHGQGQPEFVQHVYEMNRYLAQAITDSPKIHIITSPLYLVCVAFHDKRRIDKQKEHSEMSKKMMQTFYAFYVFNLHKTIDFKTKVLDTVNSI